MSFTTEAHACRVQSRMSVATWSFLLRPVCKRPPASLEVAALSHRYLGASVYALDDVSFSLEPGESLEWTGGLRWASEQPNQLIYTPVGGRTQIIEKGEAGLSEDARRMSRVAIAHPEGFPLAVANIYVDLADAIGVSAECCHERA